MHEKDDKAREEAFEARKHRRLTLRRVLSRSSYLGAPPPPGVFRPYGVSALMTGKNEEDWVETSLLSIVNLVDEVLVADHGSDDATAQIMEEVASHFPRKIRMFRFGNESFPDVLNTMMARSRFQWMFRFSADFIARNSGTNSIPQLLGILRDLDPYRYFSISHSGVALDGDLEHQFPGRRDHFEPIIFRWSPWIRFGVKDRWESLRIPWFYEKLWLRSSYYFHMRSVKSDIRMLQKLYWSYWFEARNKGSNVSLRDFITARGLSEFGGSTLEEAARKFTLLEFQGCIPYSTDACGDYPEILKPAIGHPTFRLVFVDGKLVDRVRGPRYRPERPAQA